MKTTLITIGLFFFAIASFGQTNEEQINSVFQQYQKYILAKQGIEALDVVSQDVPQYYSEVLEHVKHSDSAKLSKLEVLTQLDVLMCRYYIQPKSIYAIGGSELYAFYIINHINVNEYVLSAKLGEIQFINGLVAKAPLFVKDRFTGLEMEFKLENGEWKVNPLSILDFANQNLTALFSKSKLTVSEIMLKIMSQKLGTDVQPSIFIPIQLEAN